MREVEGGGREEGEKDISVREESNEEGIRFTNIEVVEEGRETWEVRWKEEGDKMEEGGGGTINEEEGDEDKDEEEE